MSQNELTAALFVRMLAAGTAYLEHHKETIDALNVFPVPDGDTGTNMSLTLASARRELAEADETHLGKVAGRVARGVLLGARGNSGVILSQFLRGFAQGVAECETADARDVANAFAEATKLAYRAVIKPVEGTMLTVGKGGSEAALKAVREGADLTGVLEAALAGCEEALERTPELLTVLARAGVVDAGGQGLVYFLAGALAAFRGDELPDIVEPEAQTAADVATPHGAIVADEDITFCYCTEFLIRGEKLPLDTIRASIEELGDSVLVVGDPDLIKVHVHTDFPGQALEIGVRHGDLLEISIDNMREQNRLAAEAAGVPTDADRAKETGAVPPTGSDAPGSTADVLRANGTMLGNGAAVTTVAAPDDGSHIALGEVANTETATVGVVAVAQGEGWQQLLSSLGVQQIVNGGQTMNPSAAELVTAIEAVDAEVVFVLPNNSNIIFAARQAQELTERDVHVLPTTAVPQAVAAMMAYMPQGDPESVLQEMRRSTEALRTAEVTYAVRDSEAFGEGIKAGDNLGLIDGEVRIVGTDPEETALQTIRELMTEDASLVSVYFGDDVAPDTAAQLAERIEQKWPACEVEVYGGGQPVYHYMLSVE